MDTPSLEAQSGSGALEAWAPLGLLDFAPSTPLPDVEKQGLTPVRLAWHQGRLREPMPLMPGKPHRRQPLLLDVR